MKERGGAPHPPPLKRLGQSFLSDPGILGRIVDALQPVHSQCVVEVGAGRGSLTTVLAARFGRVVAIELDRKLVPLLRERFADSPHVTIVEGDALQVDFRGLAGRSYKLCGNIPYYITTPLIFRALERPRPELCVFMVQKEVAQRVVAKPGERAYGALSVNVQTLAGVEMLFTVPAGAFQPRPKVDSAVIRLRPDAETLLPAESESAFRAFVQLVFARRRQQMQRVVREIASCSADEAVSLLDSCGVAGGARPGTVSPDTFVRLFAAISRRDQPSRFVSA
jgi:16S rRNA (adenine1518-N6/adenine1519-N6)-dimethyltransferase